MTAQTGSKRRMSELRETPAAGHAFALFDDEQVIGRQILEGLARA
jgi:hypothetical protein